MIRENLRQTFRGDAADERIQPACAADAEWVRVLVRCSNLPLRPLHAVIRASIGFHPDLERLCVAALAPLEPNVPWEEGLLRQRVECYDRAQHPLAATAHADLQTFLAGATAKD